MPRSYASKRERKHDGDPTIWQHYLRGLETSTKNNSLAYGYSLAITATFGVLFHFHSDPSVADILLFCIGGALAFAGVNAAITRGYRSRFPDEPAVVVALGTSFSAISVTAAVASAALLAWLLGGWLPWPLASFVASLVYVLGVGVEMAVAGEAHEAGGADSHGDADEGDAA